MEVIRACEMRNETVRLDKRHFIDCTFVDCVLEYGGLEVILERTAFTNCHYIFYDHALMTLQFLKATGIAPWLDVTNLTESRSASC